MLRFILAAVFALFLTAPQAIAGPQRAEVTVSVQPEGLRFDYRLSKPTKRFDFWKDTPVSAHADVTLLTPGLTRDAASITAAAPFKAFTLLVKPDKPGARDAHYAQLTRIGPDAFSIYMPPLNGEGNQWTTRFRFPSRGGMTALNGADDNSASGNLYLGPARYVQRKARVTYVLTPDTPAWLSGEIEDRMDRLMAFYEAKLGKPAQRRPLVMVSYDPTDDGGNFIGDVTDNSAILLTLHGKAFLERSTQMSGRMGRFLGHEAFHLWNSVGLNGVDDEAWVHEGGAEYASYLAGQALWPADGALESQMTGQLAQCREINRKKGLTAITGESAAMVRYTCGSVAEWLADIGIRASSRSKDDIFALWRKLLAGKTYGAADFASSLAAWPSPADRSIEIMLKGGAEDRWPAILDPLRRLGVETALSPPSNQANLQAVLFPMLQSICTGPYGYFTNPEGIMLDTAANCTALVGRPYLVSVQGIGPDRGADLYAAAAPICEAKGHLTVTVKGQDGERTEKVPCLYPATPPQPVYAVVRALPQTPSP